jgi:hypothetical protein
MLRVIEESSPGDPVYVKLVRDYYLNKTKASNKDVSKQDKIEVVVAVDERKGAW